MTLLHKSAMQWLQTIAPPLVTSVLIVLAAANLADLTWLWLQPVAKVDVAPLQANDSITAAGANQPHYGEQIAALHLFGKAEQPQAKTTQTAPAEVDVENAPETNLNLTLKGVLATGDANSFAIIATARSRSQQLYQVGDSLPGGVKLHSVYGDRVILQRSGRLETLTFPENRRAGVEAIAEAPQQTDYSQTSAAPQQVSQANSGVQLQKYRRELMRNPRQIGKMLNPRPVRRNGDFLGYQIRPRGEPELVEALGLQSGDIVTAINGVQLDKPEKGLVAARKLLNASSIDLQIQRNGRPMQINRALGE